jgi:transposase
MKRVLDLEIERLKLEIARLKRHRFGPSSERSTRLEQLELALSELEETVAAADAAQALRAAERPAPEQARRTTARKPARRPLPAHLPRTRVVYPAPASCPCCGGAVRTLGEEITESLERLPARWFVVQHVREKVSCRCCETINEAPAPFHPIARGRAGPNLLAEVMFGKYGLHLPLNRQSACFAREGIDLDVSTLAGWVGSVAASLQPLTDAIAAHVRAGQRIHADETPVPVLAKGKTRKGRLWTIVRDDRPFGGPNPPAAVFFYSPDRRGVHAARFLEGFTGIMQADAFSGFGRLYKPAVPPARSSRRRAGATRAGASSSWPSCRRRRSRSKRCSGSTRCSRSNARAMAFRPVSASPSAMSDPARSSKTSKPGCVSNAPGCRRSRRRRTPSTIYSSAGPPSPAFSMTGRFA